jgi:DNA-binding response OmpR family regulator
MAEFSLLEGKRILIVDDEPDILETLEDLLSMCEVTKASTFEEARDLLENRDFDIAVLDIMGVSGYYLLGIANRRGILSVMLTAHALSPEDTARSYREGAASYVPKDKMGEICTYIEDILEAKEEGKSLWGRWLERLSDYYNQKFGPGWRDTDTEFWDNFR